MHEDRPPHRHVRCAAAIGDAFRTASQPEPRGRLFEVTGATLRGHHELALGKQHGRRTGAGALHDEFAVSLEERLLVGGRWS